MQGRRKTDEGVYMTPIKIVALVSGVTLLAFVGGLFGPGPLVPGLGPGFDQLGVVIALTVFAAAGLWLFKSRRPGFWGGSRPTDRSAEEILRERYARGELDRTQFLFMLDDLRAPESRKP
jgi:uncharacterized membrane protein